MEESESLVDQQQSRHGLVTTVLCGRYGFVAGMLTTLTGVAIILLLVAITKKPTELQCKEMLSVWCKSLDGAPRNQTD